MNTVHSKYCYFEVSFYIPFDEIYDFGNKFIEIANIIGLKVNLDLLIDYYDHVSIDSIIIFANKDNENAFMLFDTKNEDNTDQSNMVEFGIRANLSEYQNIMNIVYDIYHANIPRGDIRIGFYNDYLLHKGNKKDFFETKISFLLKKNIKRTKFFFML